MQIQYNLSLDDYVAFNRYVMYRSGVFRAIYWVGWIIPPLGLLLIAGLLLLLEESPLVPVVCVAAAAVYAVIFAPLYRLQFEWIIRALARSLGARAILGPKTLILDEEKLTTISQIARTEVKWRHVLRVESTAEHTFIFLDGLSAVIVPGNGCERRGDYEIARDFAVTHVGREASRT